MIFQTNSSGRVLATSNQILKGDGTVTPSGKLEVTEQGTYDVTNYEWVTYSEPQTTTETWRWNTASLNLAVMNGNVPFTSNGEKFSTLYITTNSLYYDSTFIARMSYSDPSLIVDIPDCYREVTFDTPLDTSSEFGAVFSYFATKIS